MDLRLLMELRQYLTVKKHEPGQIKVKFSLSAMTHPRIRELLEFDAPSRGIKDTRLSLMSRTLTIVYDPGLIRPQVIDELFSTDDESRFQAAAQELAQVTEMEPPQT